MKTVILHNSRNASFIAATLVFLNIPNSELQCITEVSTMHKANSDVYKGAAIIFISDIPPLSVIRNTMAEAEHITYIGNDKGNATKFFVETHPKAVCFNLEEDNLIVNTVAYLKQRMGDTLNLYLDSPLIKVLSGAEPYTNEQKRDMYHAIAQQELTLELAFLFIREYTDELVLSLRDAGKIIEQSTRNFLNNIIETEVRKITIVGVEFNVVGTNKRHCSALASLMAKLKGVGCAYYDTEQYRHFEIRDPSVSLPQDFSTKIRELYEGTGSRKEMRFRVYRHNSVLGG